MKEFALCRYLGAPRRIGRFGDVATGEQVCLRQQEFASVKGSPDWEFVRWEDNSFKVKPGEADPFETAPAEPPAEPEPEAEAEAPAGAAADDGGDYPPYEEWSFADLKDEAARRGVGVAKPSKAKLAAALYADDEGE